MQFLAIVCYIYIVHQYLLCVHGMRNINHRIHVIFNNKKNKRSIFNTDNFIIDRSEGLDERYKVEDYDENALENIKWYLTQRDLLKKLENTNDSELNKLAHIEEYDTIYGKNKLAPNLLAGGLFDEWNNDR